MSTTTPTLTKADGRGLAILGHVHAEGFADRVNPGLRVSNRTADVGDRGGPVIYWQTAERLVGHGLAEHMHPSPASDLRLTVNGALYVLADLAGWTIPADAADGFVILVCAHGAAENGRKAGVPANRVDDQVRALLAVLDGRPGGGRLVEAFTAEQADR